MRLHLLLSLITYIALGTACNSLEFPRVNVQQPTAEQPNNDNPSSPLRSQLNQSDILDQRYTYRQGGLSLRPPKHWQVQQVLGFKYETFVMSSAAEFQPNLNVIEDIYAGSLDAYVSLNLKSLEKAFKNFKTISRSDFTTAAGKSGIMVVSESEQLGNSQRQILFFFDTPNAKKLVLTASSLTKDRDIFDPIFTASAKTLKLEK